MSDFVGLRPGGALLIMCLLTVGMASPAGAHSNRTAGGAGYLPLELTGAACDTPGRDGGCPQGAQLRLKGENLREAERVEFLGRRGPTDDRTAMPVKTSPHRVVVRVPPSARSGRVRVAAIGERVKGPRVAVEPAAPVRALPTTGADGGAFPIRGAYDFGTFVNRFGGGRGHKGQDVLAGCGKPVVAALPGEVTLNKSQDRAGNYVVVKADDGTSQAYMHLMEPGRVSKGDRVAAGQSIGAIGRTGNASACMLHFELWTAPGWYEGGTATDPLPSLRRWAAAR